MMISESIRREKGEHSSIDKLHKQLEEARANLEKESTAKRATEKAARVQRTEIVALKGQLSEADGLLEKKRKDREDVEAKLKVVEENFEAAMKKAEEEKEAVKQQAADDLHNSFIRYDMERIRAEPKVRWEAVDHFKSSPEGKEWRDKGVELFKDSPAGKEWCEELGAEALACSLKELIAFVNSKAPGFDWEGCELYVNPDSNHEDNIDNGEEPLSENGLRAEQSPTVSQALAAVPIQPLLLKRLLEKSYPLLWPQLLKLLLVRILVRLLQLRSFLRHLHESPLLPFPLFF